MMESFYSMEKTMWDKQRQFLAEAEHQALIHQIKQSAKTRMSKTKESRAHSGWWPSKPNNGSPAWSTDNISN